MSTTPYTREEKIAVRKALLQDLDAKVKRLGGQLPTQKQIEEDPEMKSIGGYIQVFHGIRNAWDVWVQLQAGALTDDDLAEPIRHYAGTDPEAYEVCESLAEYAEILNQTLDEVDDLFALGAAQYKIDVRETSVVYLGRVYYRSGRNAKIIIRMNEIARRVLDKHAGGAERKSLVAWVRDCGFAMKHPGTFYPYDPED